MAGVLVRLIAALAVLIALGEPRRHAAALAPFGTCSDSRSGQPEWWAARWSGGGCAIDYSPTAKSNT